MKNPASARAWGHWRERAAAEGHPCRWPGCDRFVSGEKWGCKAHWYRLPKRLRQLIHHTYRPRFEAGSDALTAYHGVMRQVRSWIAQHPPVSRAPHPADPAHRKPEKGI